MILPSRRTFVAVTIGLFVMILIQTFVSQYIFLRFEGRSLAFDQALLFVVETLSTTGYGELLPFQSPVTTAWALLLIGAGFVVIFVGLAALVGSWLSVWFQPRPPRKAPQRLNRHVLICGAGPAGRFLAEECGSAGIEYLLLDFSGPQLDQAMRSGLAVMEGDAREAEVLGAAGIAVSRALVATLADADNASICLMARALRPELPVYCMVEHAANERFLLAAGATGVVSAKRSLGERLGWLARTPLAGQLDRLWTPGDGLSFSQVPVLPGSALAAPTLKQARVRERTGATILGIWTQGHFVPALSPDTPIRPGHVLIAAGRPEELDRLRALSQTTPRPLKVPAHQVLVLGSGDVGLAAMEVLEQARVPYRVLSLRVPPGRHAWIEGDASNREDLERAGIAEAGRCVIALDDDSRAVFAALMARQLNPGLRIVARANSVESVSRLYLAGADNVLSVSEVAGAQLARLVLPADHGPPALDELATKEVTVPAALVGTTLSGGSVTKRAGCIVLAIRNAAGELMVNPSPRRLLDQGENLILFGTEAQFSRFSSLFGN